MAHDGFGQFAGTLTGSGRDQETRSFIAQTPRDLGRKLFGFRVRQQVTHKVDQTFVPVHAAEVVASGQVAGHPGTAAVDEALDTYWQAPAGVGVYPSLTLTFQHSVTLERLVIHSGVANAYTAHGRPSQVVLIYSNQESDSLDLMDTALIVDEPFMLPAHIDLAALRAKFDAGTLPPMFVDLINAPTRRQVDDSLAAAKSKSALLQRLEGLPEDEQQSVLLDLVRSNIATVLGNSSPEAVPIVSAGVWR